MPKRIDRRQKPIWKTIHKPIPPATKLHSTKKGKKGYDRKKKAWKEEIGWYERKKNLDNLQIL